jgi:hypothetical protein
MELNMESINTANSFHSLIKHMPYGYRGVAANTKKQRPVQLAVQIIG